MAAIMILHASWPLYRSYFHTHKIHISVGHIGHVCIASATCFLISYLEFHSPNILHPLYNTATRTMINSYKRSDWQMAIARWMKLLGYIHPWASTMARTFYAARSISDTLQQCLVNLGLYAFSALQHNQGYAENKEASMESSVAKIMYNSIQ